MEDKRGAVFLNQIFETPPLMFEYMINARKGKRFDFKITNGMNRIEDGINIYRGMVIGLTDNGQAIITSARDIGNIAAGYVAGSNGMPWRASRIAFDLYQTKGKQESEVEGVSTVNAEYYGWEIGNNNPSIKKVTNLFNSIWGGLGESFNYYNNK